MAGPPGLPCSGGGGPFDGAASGSRLADPWGLLPKGGRVLQGQRQRTRGQRSPAPDCAERTGDEGRLGAGHSPAGDRASGGRVESGVNPGPGRAEQIAARKTIIIVESTTILYPKRGLREKTGIISPTTPNAGSTMMYTTGCE